MNITLVNHSDTLGGASVVTVRLMNALADRGHRVTLLVTDRRTNLPSVEKACSNLRRRVPFVLEHLRILGGNGFSKRDMFKVSIATDGLPLASHPAILNADAVLLNWVNQGMLSLDEIGRIARSKPTLWTMHDMWNMTAVCHHAADCTAFGSHCANCPQLNSGAGPRDLSFKTFERKMRLYRSAPITHVAVSSWLASKARCSALLGNRPVEVIHNAFPVSDYARPPKYSRHDLGLPADKKLIVFCAARIDDPIKNLPLAIQGLNALNRPDTAAVFVGGVKNPDALADLAMPHVHLGPVYDSERMHSIMSHAHAVLSTSHNESLPTVLIEAQAAGAIPVGLTHDGRADIITDGTNGYSIAEPTPQAVARALERSIDCPLAREALAEAAMRFAPETIAAKYEDLIHKVSGT